MVIGRIKEDHATGDNVVERGDLEEQDELVRFSVCT